MASIDVKIPPLGESISTGILSKWHVADGATVKKDQALFELETDKITSEGTAEAAGRITLKVAPGTEVKIGQVVATLDPAATGAAPAPASGPVTADAAAKAVPAAPSTSGHPSSPAVRRVAEETGIDPSTLTGSGKAGRVTKGDVLAAAEVAPKTEVKREEKPVVATPAPAPAPLAAVPAGARQSRRKLTPLRKRIAERLVQAQHEAAMLTTFNEVDMSAVMGLRAKYQDDFVKKNGLKLGFMSFFTKAVVNALKEVPAINAQFAGDEIIQNHYFDIGVAVSTEKGLMVPVIRNADQLGMADIEKAIGDAAKKARDGKITLADLEGGVFTITNGGIFGSMLSTPILNAPQSAILGLHAITERPVALNGQVVIRPMMYLALSYDHRLVDGKEAVTFLVKVKQAIEDPARLLLAI
ncbi:MAG: 2-oxoglutarate dehydrogenase complex dihydrolipoyllysine-residue succinyltransferase [Opitutaceae bacterium]|nr:2-oxoglutarate dehydrogenase complex dihydrolipoyllysine-residue succinyltransferase [Opitutaceae bacterium]